MTKKEYVEDLSMVKIDDGKVSKIEGIYGASLPDIIKRIVSNVDDTVFFEDDWRMLSLSEIEEAEMELHVEFGKKGILPLVDCGENDFIVYHFKDKFWSKFNIVDEVIFQKKNTIEELLK